MQMPRWSKTGEFSSISTTGTTWDNRFVHSRSADLRAQQRQQVVTRRVGKPMSAMRNIAKIAVHGTSSAFTTPVHAITRKTITSKTTANKAIAQQQLANLPTGDISGLLPTVPTEVPRKIAGKDFCEGSEEKQPSIMLIGESMARGARSDNWMVVAAWEEHPARSSL